MVRRVSAIAEPAATPKITTQRKTASSEIFPSSRADAEDVDGGEDDEPHDVDEVPVDPGHLDAEMVLGVGPEVAAEGADRGEAEEHETDEDVGAVQAGEAVEDRAEGEIASAEADVGVLVELDEEEGRPSSQVSTRPSFSPCLLPCRTDSRA